MPTVPIERIRLSPGKIAEPNNAFVIQEHYFGVANHTPEGAYLLTRGLIVCKALTFYRPDQKQGLLCHLSQIPWGKLESVINLLVTEFGEDLSDSTVNLVVGIRQKKEIPTVIFPLGKKLWMKS